MTHARRIGCVALGFAAVATLGGTGTASADAGGSISGLLWFDRNQDQVRDVGEPTRNWQSGLVQVYRDGVLLGSHDTDPEGRYTVTDLAPGTYHLTYADAGRYVSTTPSAVDVEVVAGGQATVDFGMKGGSISGQQWLDLDFDGRWDTNEGLVPPHTVVNPTHVSGSSFGWAEQDDRGTYVVHDLPSGDSYVVHVIGPQLPYTKENRDSKVNWFDGSSGPVSLAPGQEVTGINAGYARVKGDSAITSGSVAPDRTQIQVGEEVTFTLSFTNKGQVPDHLDMSMTWPAAGFELVRSDGLTTTFGPGVLYGGLTRKLAPRESITFTVVLRATAPIARSNVTFSTTPSQIGDGNPSNDRKTFPVRVVS